MTYTSCGQLLPVRMPGNISDDLLNTVKDIRHHLVLIGREWFVRVATTPHDTSCTWCSMNTQSIANTAPSLYNESLCLGGWIPFVGCDAASAQCHQSGHRKLQSRGQNSTNMNVSTIISMRSPTNGCPIATTRVDIALDGVRACIHVHV